MLTRETITVGTQRFRVGPWQGTDDIALLSVPATKARPSTVEVAAALDAVRSRGYRKIMTSALAESERDPFLRLGFVESDRLHVFEHRLVGLAGSAVHTQPGLRLRRGRPADRAEALRLDHRAFPAFWRLDATGFAEARAATPTSRFRIAELDDVPVGYCVTGRGGESGFVQRLATDPAHLRRGIASHLVTDALRWSARRGCTRVLVNTQVTNAAALGLYRALGFARLPDDLVVLSWSAT